MDNNIENDKLIDKFMGHNNEDIFLYPDEQLPTYSDSWDKLMPVVEKIETIECKEGGKFELRQFNHEEGTQSSWYVSSYMYTSLLSCIQGKDRKESTYKAVVEFINWYNKNK